MVTNTNSRTLILDERHLSRLNDVELLDLSKNNNFIEESEIKVEIEISYVMLSF